MLSKYGGCNANPYRLFMEKVVYFENLLITPILLYSKLNKELWGSNFNRP